MFLSPLLISITCSAPPDRLTRPFNLPHSMPMVCMVFICTLSHLPSCSLPRAPVCLLFSFFSAFTNTVPNGAYPPGTSLTVSPAAVSYYWEGTASSHPELHTVVIMICPGLVGYPQIPDIRPSARVRLPPGCASSAPHGHCWVFEFMPTFFEQHN